jgi:hypothetical protein
MVEPSDVRGHEDVMIRPHIAMNFTNPVFVITPLT